jgi:hypothetical protein
LNLRQWYFCTWYLSGGDFFNTETRREQRNTESCLSGTGDEEAQSIIKTPDGGYLVTGYTNSTDGDVSNYLGGANDGWVVKLSPPGLNIKDPEFDLMDLSVIQQPQNISLRFFCRKNSKATATIYNIPSCDEFAYRFDKKNHTASTDIRPLFFSCGYSSINQGSPSVNK